MMTNSTHTFEDASSLKRYSSFLLRCWRVGEGELRIKIEHIQSGNETQANTYEAALVWLSERCCGPVDHPACDALGSQVDYEPP